MQRYRIAPTAHQTPCIMCGSKMGGICADSTRTVCEECGGNETKFNKKSPHPESAFNKKHRPKQEKKFQ